MSTTTPNLSGLGHMQRSIVVAMLKFSGSKLRLTTDDQAPGWKDVALYDSEGDEIAWYDFKTFERLQNRNILIAAGSDRMSLDVTWEYFQLHPAVKENYYLPEPDRKFPHIEIESL